jgi:hypothetical protein
VRLDLTVSSHRIAPGSRLVLRISPNDTTITQPTLATDALQLIHDDAHPSTLTVPVVSATRLKVAGPVPSGPSFPGDTVATVCTAFGISCG